MDQNHIGQFVLLSTTNSQFGMFLGLIIITAFYKVTATSSSLGPAVRLVLNKDKFGHPTVDDTFPGNPNI